MIKKVLPKEDSIEAYAVGFISGAACFLYFTIMVLFFGKGAGMMETAVVFFAAYIIHHLLYVSKGQYKKLEKEMPCSDRLIYRSLLYFFTALSLLMFASTKLG